MCFWQSCKTWFKNNEKDILAILVMSFVIVAILSSYTFNTIAPQEGWYSIYARNILKDGLVPYKDFFLVVPPLHLYIWTIWQAVFGDNFIVFHYLNFIFQIGCVVSLYYLFKQIFNRKISFLISLFLTSYNLFSVFDNGVASYNILTIIFMAILAILTVKQVDFIKTDKQINNKYLWWTGAIFALSFLNKQTNGAFTITSSCLILMTVTYKILGFKQAYKHFLNLFLISVSFVFIVLLPLIIAGAVPSLIDLMSRTSSKGSLYVILVKIMMLPFNKDCILYYILLIIIFFFMSRRLKTLSWDRDEGGSIRYYLTTVLAFVAISFLTYNQKFYNTNPSFISFDGWVNYFTFLIFYISLFFILLIVLYLAYLYFKGKKIGKTSGNLLMISLILFTGTMADCMSNVMFHPQFFMLSIGLLLFWKWNKLNKIKNVTVTLVVTIIFTIFYCKKLYSPMLFWGWQSGSVLGQLESSFIPKLKGMKIPAEEKQMYEEVYNIVHQYTNEDDKILAFNNNQIFYDLTERKPYTPYISLYHDVSPDNQALEVLENMKNDLPKVIIFLRFSDDIEKFHEEMYRGHTSGQRILRDYISSLINAHTYIPVKKYNRETVVNLEKLPTEELQAYEAYKNGKMGDAEGQKFLGGLYRFAEVKNDFIPQGCILLVLVRQDLIRN